MNVGESITENLLYVSTAKSGYAVDTETGHVYHGNPCLGMGRQEMKPIIVPPVPGQDASPRTWQRWAAECRVRIERND